MCMASGGLSMASGASTAKGNNTKTKAITEGFSENLTSS